jgi:hypothetical protein
MVAAKRGAPRRAALRKQSGTRKALLVLVLGAAGMHFMAGVASATHTDSPAPGPPHDFVYGAVKVTMGPSFDPRDTHLHVNAKSDFNGLNPQGTFFIQLEQSASLGPVTVSGRVTCLEVIFGNSAGVSGEITKTTDPSQAPVGNSFLMRYQDFGEPGSDAVSPDRARAIQFGFPLTTCPQDIGTFPIERGNFVVHDSVLP